MADVIRRSDLSTKDFEVLPPGAIKPDECSPAAILQSGRIGKSAIYPMSLSQWIGLESRQVCASHHLNLNPILRPRSPAIVKFTEMAGAINTKRGSVLGIGECPGYAMQVWKDQGFKKLSVAFRRNKGEDRKLAPCLSDAEVHHMDVRNDPITYGQFDLVTCDVMADFDYLLQPYRSAYLEWCSLKWALANCALDGTVILKVMSSRLPYTWGLLKRAKSSKVFHDVTVYKSPSTSGNEEIYAILHRYRCATWTIPMFAEDSYMPIDVVQMLLGSLSQRRRVLRSILANPGRYTLTLRDEVMTVTGPPLKERPALPPPPPKVGARDPLKTVAAMVKTKLCRTVYGSVLDLGCGSGFRIGFNGLYHGLDLCDVTCEIPMDANEYPFERNDRRYAWVTAIHSAHHFPDALLRALIYLRSSIILVITHEDELPEGKMVGWRGAEYCTGKYKDSQPLYAGIVRDLAAIAKRDLAVDLPLNEWLGTREMGTIAEVMSVWRVLQIK
jgi:hypothetical protein